MWWQLVLVILVACYVFPHLIVWLVKTVEAWDERSRDCHPHLRHPDSLPNISHYT